MRNLLRAGRALLPAVTPLLIKNQTKVMLRIGPVGWFFFSYQKASDLTGCWSRKSRQAAKYGLSRLGCLVTAVTRLSWRGFRNHDFVANFWIIKLMNFTSNFIL
jgi:hypothetical protein